MNSKSLNLNFYKKIKKPHKLFNENNLGDYLIVAIDTDERVKRLKGDKRPFNNLGERVEFLSSLKYVKDIVTFGSDEELEKQILNYLPDIMVKGSDWKGKEIIGGKYVKDIVFFDLVENKSTTKILTYENNSNR